MIDKHFIGYEFTPFTTTIEQGRLKFFAKAIGETNPIYTCEEAAKAAGHKSILAPPTFPFTLSLESDDPFPVVTALKLEIGRILHGSQHFEYFAPIYAGDEITVSSKIVDIFDKKEGALEFVTLQYSFTNQDGDLVATSTNILVYRNG
ncbi:MaoC family dehydratase N-terminal domain-containing protein [Pseudoteredinibacter isoporae]|uniref:MaoC family dehydratase N-terminal domain-containing protein n=1 Tax=Pseudoteredinibacter isoporae TaxID=570281 RepID=UPI0031090D04